MTASGGIKLGASDLHFSGSDPGDIVWFNGSGAETERLWSQNGGGSLNYRTNAGTTYSLVHTGNISSQSVNYASSNLSKIGNDSTGYQYTFSKIDDHAIQVGNIRGYGSNGQSGNYLHIYERVHIGSPSGWGSRSAPSYGLSTYGGAWLATDTGNVGIGTTGPDYKLTVAGNLSVQNVEHGIRTYYGFNYHPAYQDGAGRPGLSISGWYPYIWLIGGNRGNSSHGATLTLSAMDDGSATSGAFKGWTFGVPGYNATWMDLGYGSHNNPHYHGQNGYTSGWSGRVMRFTPDQITIWGAGNDCTPSLLVNSSRNGSWTYGGGFMAPNLSGGSNIYVPVGQSMSTRNSIGLTHYHYGSGSTSNFAAMEIWGVGNIQRWYYGDLRTWFAGRVDASGFYHNSYGSSAYALTSDGGAAHIGSMSVNYANSAGSAGSVAWSNVSDKMGSDNWRQPLCYINGYTSDLPRLCLHIPGSHWANISVDSNAYFHFRQTNSASGTYTNIYMSNAYASSDRHLKKNIQDIDRESLDELFEVCEKLFKKFTWKSSGKDSYGLIAQAIEKYIPEAVSESNDGSLSINYEVAYAKLLAMICHVLKTNK